MTQSALFWWLSEIIRRCVLAENNTPWMKEIEGSWGDEATAPVTSEQMILFCLADGTRKHESSVRLSPLTHSVFHRGHSMGKKKTVSALKYIGWNETQENCASFSLWSDAFRNAWSHSLNGITIWTMANSVWSLLSAVRTHFLAFSEYKRAEDQNN